MITKFKNKTISSVLTVFPQQVIDFMDEMDNYGYSELKMNKLNRFHFVLTLIILLLSAPACNTNRATKGAIIGGAAGIFGPSVQADAQKRALLILSYHPTFPTFFDQIEGSVRFLYH